MNLTKKVKNNNNRNYSSFYHKSKQQKYVTVHNKQKELIKKKT